MTPKPSYFFVIDGIDGGGKTTMAAHLAQYLRDTHGYQTHNLREPGTTAVGEHIRTLLKDAEIGGRMSSIGRALLINAGRYELVQIIRETLAMEGQVVILDRYALSTLAYQGVEDTILDIVAIGMDGLVPDLTLLMDVDPKVGASRAVTDQHGDWMDQLGLSRKESMRSIMKHYVTCPHLSQAHVIIDANGSMESVREAVEKTVDHYLLQRPCGNIQL